MKKLENSMIKSSMLNYYYDHIFKLSEEEFVSLFLSCLRKNRIRSINIDELSKKLFPYSLNFKYQILFKYLQKDTDKKIININKGINKEENIYGNIKKYSSTKMVVELLYKNGYNQKLEETIFNKYWLDLLKEIVNDFVIRHNLEDYKTNIYGYNPNMGYKLIRGLENKKTISLQLITDGNVKIVKTYDISPNKQYKDPTGDKDFCKFNCGIISLVEVRDASYVIAQGKCNDKIKKISIYTDILDKDKLKLIKDIAKIECEETLEKTNKVYIKKML